MGLREAQPRSFAFSSFWFGIWAVWNKESSFTVCRADAFSFCEGCRSGGGVCDQGLGKDGCAPRWQRAGRAAVCSGSDSSVPVAGSCGQWSCSTCGHGYFTAEAAELSFQLPASLFSSCEGESIAAGLFWHHNPVDPFPQACPHCGLEPAAALSNVMLVIKPKCYKATSLLSEN